MFMVKSSEVSGDVPGLQSVASAIGTRVAAEELDRRPLASRAGNKTRREAARRRRRPPPSPHAGLVGILEMIGRKRAEAGGERRAVQCSTTGRHAA